MTTPFHRKPIPDQLRHLADDVEDLRTVPGPGIADTLRELADEVERETTQNHARFIPIDGGGREGGDPRASRGDRWPGGRSRSYRAMYPGPYQRGEALRRAVRRGKELMRERGLE